MNVYDYKVNCLLLIFKEWWTFWKYEKSLLQCSSFAEQKVVLRNFYVDRTVTRDRLLARQSALENKKAFGLKEIIFGFKDFYIGALASILTLYLDRYFSSDLSISLSEGKVFAVFIAALFVLTVSSSFCEKIRDSVKILPLREIYDFELRFVNQVLADGREEIDVDILIEELE